jgi:isopentenyldiphosphate isomerase
MLEEDELLDLVDANDRVVGSVMREQYHDNTAAYVQKGQYFRGSACFLVDSRGKLWIPRRQLHRKVAPGGLDFSMAEHIQSGETHIQGTVRGMQEELRLVVRPDELQEIGLLKLDDIGCMMRLYVYRSDKDPDFNPDDYSEAWWLSPDELKQRLALEGGYKNALPAGLELYRSYFKL